jgi:hypothetical protein
VTGVRKTLAVTFDRLVGRHGWLGENESLVVMVLLQWSFCNETLNCDLEAGLRGSRGWATEPYIYIYV